MDETPPTGQPDYARLIDAETWAFIRRTESWYPPEAATFTIAEQRAVYDRMCQAFDVPWPAGVTADDAPLDGVPCRTYLPAAAPSGTVVYLHGGGFVVGGLHSHDAVCAEICGATGLRVVSADYRLSPEHHHPAAFEDARAVVRAAAAAQGGPLVLAGDSAGANLAAAVAHATRREGLPIAGLALVYPGLGRDLDTRSCRVHAHAPMLTRDDLIFYRGVRYAGGNPPSEPDPTAHPLDDTDFSGLPPTFILCAECDPLADDGPLYAARIAAAGGRSLCLTETGLVHGYLRARHSVDRARQSFARLCGGISALARGEWPPAPPRGTR